MRTEAEVAATLEGWLEGRRLDDRQIKVRVEVDRGRWFVDLTGAGLTRWYDADVWSRCLEGAGGAIAGFEEQARFVMRSLEWCEEALADPTFEDCLRKHARDRVARRLGLSR